MAQHCKSGSGERRFAIVMNDNFRLTADLETYVRSQFGYGIETDCSSPFRHAYNTQIMQSEALGFAYRSWRREWRGEGKQYVRFRVFGDFRMMDSAA